MTTLHDELNQIGSGMLLRRVRAAEAVAWQALNITPLKDETAEQLLTRIRFSAERNHPELLVRFEHSRQDIYRRAEDCGCDPNADDYDDNHSESDEGGEYLCGRQHLGTVCGTCENEADDGPSWQPDRYEWPCPTVRALDSVERGEETHVVADDSSNPEHIDDCPGCETAAARPAATTQDGGL